MDAILGQLISQGGAWITVAVLLVVLGGTVKAAELLLRREWARSDAQAATILQLAGQQDKLLNQQEKLLNGQERMERQLDGLRPRAR